MGYPFKGLSKCEVVVFYVTLTLALFGVTPCRAAPLVIDHTCADISRVPTNWIAQVKQRFHIAYGHTSDGSRLTTGMTGLVSFMNDKRYPPDLFAWNDGGSGGALDLRDNPFVGAADLGNPDFTAWETATRNYLTNHTECNLVMWAWCTQLSAATEDDVNLYLSLMDGLEHDFTNVTFIHMTGRLDYSGIGGNLNIRNNQIRSHCRTNSEVLYDFADIESFDPEGLTNYMVLLASQACDYTLDGHQWDNNWAVEWQNSHTQGVDWYNCPSAHSEPLNANLKAYAVWWLLAQLAGWSGPYTFDQWQRNHFSAAELSKLALEGSLWGRWADPDADGLPNIFEYALGQEPRSPGPTGVSLKINADGFATGPVVSYERAANIVDVSFRLEYSANLNSWTSLSGGSVSNRVEALGNGLERVNAHLLTPPTPGPCFYRLRLAAN